MQVADLFTSYFGHLLLTPAIAGLFINPTPKRGSLSVVSFCLMRMAIIYHFGQGDGSLIKVFEVVPQSFVLLTAIAGLVLDLYVQAIDFFKK